MTCEKNEPEDVMSYKVKGGKVVKGGKGTVNLRDIGSDCDIQVDAKGDRCVMLIANAVGRRVVENAFPDVEWETDELFASCHSNEWLFTHIRVTRLPPHLEKKIPLVFASPDSLGFAVALRLQRNHALGRVIFWTGQGEDLKIGKLGTIPEYDADADVELYGEYVRLGTLINEPVWGKA
jgi:hypothetical protein